jgi:hypothetical protein
MLIEIWERLRGYDKGIETEATILSSELIDPITVSPRDGDFILRDPIKNPFVQWLSRCAIQWTDRSGVSHIAGYTVSEGSRLFLLYEGKTVSIRYNPTNPDEYYNRLLLRNGKFMAFLSSIYITCVAATIIFLFIELFRMSLFRNLWFS